MGNVIASLTELFNFQYKKRVLMLGLDGAVAHLMFLIGFNIETILYKNVEFTIYDVGGQEKIRPLWRKHFQGTNGIIFVVDSNDTNRLVEAMESLKKLLYQEDPLQHVAFLIFGNKQDLPNALGAVELTEQLGLQKVVAPQPWHVQPCVASRGEGLYEGLSWLSRELKKQ